jgi:hypothetical protein
MYAINATLLVLPVKELEQIIVPHVSQLNFCKAYPVSALVMKILTFIMPQPQMSAISAILHARNALDQALPNVLLVWVHSYMFPL